MEQRKYSDFYKQVEKITDTIRKRRLMFYDLFRMSEYKLPNKSLNYITKIKAIIKE